MLPIIKTRQSIAARLKQAREKAGYLSVDDFCKKHQLSLASYLACEQGKMVIKFSHVTHYCKLLNISLHWLLLGKEKKMLLQNKKVTLIIKTNTNNRQ